MVCWYARGRGFGRTVECRFQQLTFELRLSSHFSSIVISIFSCERIVFFSSPKCVTPRYRINLRRWNELKILGCSAKIHFRCLNSPGVPLDVYFIICYKCYANVTCPFALTPILRQAFENGENTSVFKVRPIFQLENWNHSILSKILPVQFSSFFLTSFFFVHICVGFLTLLEWFSILQNMRCSVGPSSTSHSFFSPFLISLSSVFHLTSVKLWSKLLALARKDRIRMLVLCLYFLFSCSKI